MARLVLLAVLLGSCTLGCKSKPKHKFKPPQTQMYGLEGLDDPKINEPTYPEDRKTIPDPANDKKPNLRGGGAGGGGGGSGPTSPGGLGGGGAGNRGF